MTAETSIVPDFVVAVIVVVTRVFAFAGTESTNRNYSDGSVDTQQVNQFDGFVGKERVSYLDADKEPVNYCVGFVGMEPLSYLDDSVDNETANYFAGSTLDN